MTGARSRIDNVIQKQLYEKELGRMATKFNKVQEEAMQYKASVEATHVYLDMIGSPSILAGKELSLSERVQLLYQTMVTIVAKLEDPLSEEVLIDWIKNNFR